MQPVRIPTQQDEPAWFLAWRTDEIVPFLILFATGVITRHLTICCLIGYVIFKVYQKLRVRFPRGYLVHWAFGHGLWVFSMSRSMRDPYARRFISNSITPPINFSNLKLKKKDKED